MNQKLFLLLASLALFFLPGVVYAAEQQENKPAQQETGQATEASSNGEETAEEPENERQRDRLDSGMERFDSQVQRASLWVDSFFADPEYEAEEAYSQIRLRPEYYYRKEQGSKFKMRFRARLNLPNLGRRVSLVAGADEDGGEFDDSVDDSADDGIIGLQFFMKESTRWNTSISVGMKFNDFAFFVGPRFRYTGELGKKSSYRFTQTVRWQTNQYWQINSRLDLNRAISERFYFRQTFDGRWRGEDAKEQGYRTRISSYLTQRLGQITGLQYEFSTIFHTKPDTHVDEYRVAFRFRRQTNRQWLYYEIVPQFSFEDEFDYKFNPGIRLRLEFFFGGSAAKRRWSREAEDTEDFRW